MQNSPLPNRPLRALQVKNREHQALVTDTNPFRFRSNRNQGANISDGLPTAFGGQPFLALPGVGLNSFFKSLRPSERRGHSQENEWLVHSPARRRARISPLVPCCLAGRCCGSGTLATSLFSEARCNCCSGCFAAAAAAMVLRR